MQSNPKTNVNLQENEKLIERMNEIESSKISEVDKRILRDIEMSMHSFQMF